MSSTGVFVQPAWGSPATLASRGVELVAGGLVRYDHDAGYLMASSPSPGRQVGIVSGGGAGHEPLHAGFVGRGGLDAACPGEVFTSPHNRQIFEASRAAAKRGGVLHVVKNYTGDVLNFSIAAERLRGEGVEVATVLVDDDLGSGDSEVGRRGTAATVVVEKILGAAADAGLTLHELADLGHRVGARTRSVAVAVQAHRLLDTGEAAFDLEGGHFEFGVGIHGERGSSTIAAGRAEDVVTAMIDQVVAATGRSSSAIVLVNGLGGTSNLELLNIGCMVDRDLAARGVVVESLVAGTYVAALDMRGFSVTVCDAEAEWLPWWYADHETLSLPSPRSRASVGDTTLGAPRDADTGHQSPRLASFAARAVSLRDALNALDRRSGDGDFGENFAKGATSAVTGTSGTTDDVAMDLRALADAFLDHVGGSSGPLFGMLLDHVARAVAAEDPADHAGAVLRGLRRGCDAVTRVGGAHRGDRTLLDALGVCFDGSSRSLDEEVVRSAIDGARATSDMRPRRGRASYLGERAMGAPDPGAAATAVLVLVLWEWITGRSDSSAWDDIDLLLAT